MWKASLHGQEAEQLFAISCQPPPQPCPVTEGSHGRVSRAGLCLYELLQRHVRRLWGRIPQKGGASMQVSTDLICLGSLRTVLHRSV